MRELKFRQAIFFKGQFIDFHYWGFISEGNFTAPQCGNQEALKNSMQYLGYKDKNGKEIYGNDIVIIQDEFDNFLQEYNEEKDEYINIARASLIHEGHEPHITIKPINYNEDDYDVYLGLLTLEVIGNEFETPELLIK